MIHLLVALANHRQLARLRAEELPEIEASIRAALSARPLRPVWSGPGLMLAAGGPEEGAGASAVAGIAAAALGTLAYLRSRRDGLFGFALLLDARSGRDPAGIAKAMEAEVLSRQAEESLWVGVSIEPLFRQVLGLESRRGLYRATLSAPPTPAASDRELPAATAEEPTRLSAAPWQRTALVERCLEALAPRLNGSEERALLFLHGPAGAGKTALAAEVARRLAAAPVLRAWALFRRRTPVHPFLNSIDAGLLAEVPRFLRGPERGVWDDLGGELAFIVGGGGEGRYPDHLAEDFSIVYGLYARAWARRCASMLVPAVAVLEGVEGWHPAARALACRLLEDLAEEPGTLAIVTSALPSPPSELAGLPIIPIAVHPLGRREIRSLARHLFPGLELPETVVRLLRRRSDGRFVSVVSYLQYLARTGRIVSAAGGHAWQRGVDPEAAALPTDPLSVSWFLMSSLAEDAFLLLYGLYLAAGMVDREGLLAFLAGEGFERTATERSLEGLQASGLVAEQGSLVPRFPRLMRRLEELLGGEAARLHERFLLHLVALWERGAYPREVLLFSFLARSGRTDLAMRLLPGIIRRKLEERDLSGARAFSTPDRLEFAVPPDAGQRERLAVITATGRLRAATLEQRFEEAAGVARELARLEHAGIASELRGEAALAEARFFLSSGDSSSALEASKRALIAFQEATGAEAARGERTAFRLLGATMLADGRVGEAVDYLGLAERQAADADDRYGALEAGALLATARFLEGRLDRAAEAAAAARRMADAVGQRSKGCHLSFLAARVLFQIGSYEACGTELQDALCRAELYSLHEAETVLDAWLGRAQIYLGQTVAGAARLERLEPTREVLFFLAEAALFTGDDGAALRCVERALAAPAPAGFPPADGVAWSDGFASIEGRTFSLARAGASLQRPLVALRGYLLARSGNAAGAHAVGELAELARSTRPADLDPSAYLYPFLHACTLPDESGGESDDRSTVLSRALKGLQERASRIDDPAARSSFLASNRWNRLIMEEARERRLSDVPRSGSPLP